MTETTAARSTTLREVVRVAANRLADFEATLARLNRKAAKLGLPDVAVLERRDEQYAVRLECVGDGETIVRTLVPLVPGVASEHGIVTVHAIALAFEILRLGDWSVVARLDRLDTGAVIALPLADGAEHGAAARGYAERGAIACEHCRTARDRREGYVLHSQGRYMAVGTTCLAEFTGIDPAAVLSMADMVSAVRVAYADDAGGWAGGRSNAFEPVTILAAAACVIERCGFTSSRVARERGGQATFEVVLDVLHDSHERSPLRREFTARRAEFHERAQRTLAWAAQIDTARASDFERTMALLLAQPLLSLSERRYVATVVAAVPAHARATSLAAAATGPGRWLGEKGKRLTFCASVARRFTVEGAWGTSVGIILLDAEGNTIKLVTSAPPAEFADAGERRVRFAATVKDHDTYREVRQTVVTRAKFVGWDDAGVQAPQPGAGAAAQACEPAAPTAAVALEPEVVPA